MAFGCVVVEGCGAALSPFAIRGASRCSSGARSTRRRAIEVACTQRDSEGAQRRCAGSLCEAAHLQACDWEKAPVATGRSTQRECANHRAKDGRHDDSETHRAAAGLLGGDVAAEQQQRQGGANLLQVARHD
eukprot:5113592-Prymnesium_polylepis.1